MGSHSVVVDILHDIWSIQITGEISVRLSSVQDGGTLGDQAHDLWGASMFGGIGFYNYR